MWNPNQRQGKIDEAKGRINRPSALTGNRDLKAEVERDETVGKVEGAVGWTGKLVADAVTKVAEAVKK
jgi:uncharacterized protein YjbJ (UPF0337 family)